MSDAMSRAEDEPLLERTQDMETYTTRTEAIYAEIITPLGEYHHRSTTSRRLPMLCWTPCS